MLKRKKVVNNTVTVNDKARIAHLGAESAMTMFTKVVKEVKASQDILKEVMAECEEIERTHAETRTKAEESIAEYDNFIKNIEGLVGGTK